MADQRGTPGFGRGGNSLFGPSGSFNSFSSESQTQPLISVSGDPSGLRAPLPNLASSNAFDALRDRSNDASKTALSRPSKRKSSRELQEAEVAKKTKETPIEDLMAKYMSMLVPQIQFKPRPAFTKPVRQSVQSSVTPSFSSDLGKALNESVEEFQTAESTDFNDIRSRPGDLHFDTTVARTTRLRRAVGSFRTKDQEIFLAVSLRVDFGKETQVPRVMLILSVLGPDGKRDRKVKIQAGPAIPTQSGKGFQLQAFQAHIATRELLQSDRHRCDKVDSLYARGETIKDIDGGRMIIVDFTVQHGKFTEKHIDLDTPNAVTSYFKSAKAPRNELDFCRSLYGDASSEVIVYICVPDLKRLQETKRDLDFFSRMVEARVPPNSIYYTFSEGVWKQKSLDLSLAPAHQLFDGALARPSAPVKQSLSSALMKANQVKSDEQVKQIQVKQLEFQFGFDSVQNFSLIAQLQQLREHQAANASLAIYMGYPYKVIPIKGFAPIDYHLKVFWFVVVLPEHLQESGCDVPEDGIRFEISSSIFATRPWYGMVTKLNKIDRINLGTGNFIISCAVKEKDIPEGFSFAQSCEEYQAANRYGIQVQLTAIFDTTTCQRSMSAVRTLAKGRSRAAKTLLSEFVNMRVDPAKKKTVDATVGPFKVGYVGGDPDNEITEAGNDNKNLYGTIMNIFARAKSAGVAAYVLEAGSDEHVFLNLASTQIQYGVQVVLGGPGVGKTTTSTVWLFNLMLIGHKILVTSKQHKTVNIFSKAMERRRQEFIQIIDALLKIPTGAASDAALQMLRDRAVSKKICRFTAGSQDAKLLDHKDFLPENRSEMVNLSSRNVGSRAIVDEHYLALMTSVQGIDEVVHRVCQIQEAGEGDADTFSTDLDRFTDIRDEKIAAMQATQEKYAAIPHQDDRNIAIHANHHAVHFINVARNVVNSRESKKPETKLESAVRDFDAANEAYHAETDTKKALEFGQDLKRARDTMFGEVFKDVDMVVTTCGSVAHSYLQKNFKPSISMIEQSSTIDMGSALPTWMFDADIRVSVGDLKQSEPYRYRSQLNEVSSLMKVSNLLGWISRGHTPVKLMTQKRGHHDLYSFPSEQYFDGMLKSHEMTKAHATHANLKAFHEVMQQIHVPDANLEPVFTGGFFLVNVTGSSDALDDTTTLKNQEELQLVFVIVLKLVERGVSPKEITILCYYNGQVTLAKRWLQENYQLSTCRGIIISLVDSYIGHSNSIVLITSCANVKYMNGGRPVVSKHIMDPHRTCIALTRGVHAVAILGEWQPILAEFKIAGIATQDRNGKKPIRNHAKILPLVNMIRNARRRNCFINADDQLSDRAIQSLKSRNARQSYNKGHALQAGYLIHKKGESRGVAIDWFSTSFTGNHSNLLRSKFAFDDAGLQSQADAVGMTFDAEMGDHYGLCSDEEILEKLPQSDTKLVFDSEDQSMGRFG